MSCALRKVGIIREHTGRGKGCKIVAILLWRISIARVAHREAGLYSVEPRRGGRVGVVSWVLVMIVVAQIRGQPLVITSVLSHMSRGVSSTLRVQERSTVGGQ